MIRKPTSDEFAYGAISFGLLLLGIVIGVWLGGHDNVREWTAALSGWAATIVGGLAAFAAFRTVRAVRDQIAANREDSQLVASETKVILDELLFDIFKELELAWRILDYRGDDSLQPEHQDQAWHLPRYYVVSALPKYKMDRVEAAIELLNPIDKERCQAIYFALVRLLDGAKFPEKTDENTLIWTEDEDRINPETRADLVAVFLSHLHKEAEKYDAKLAKIFAGRDIIVVNHDPQWSFMERSIANRISQWEAAKK